MARLNSARFLVSPANCRRTRMAQISDSLSGGFCPMSLPLFQAIWPFLRFLFIGHSFFGTFDRPLCTASRVHRERGVAVVFSS